MMTQRLPPSYALPQLDDLTRPWPIAPWLAGQFKELALSDKIYRRFAAMGLVLNRFTPDDLRDMTAFVDGDHDREIDARIMVWLNAQTPEDMKEVSHLAEIEALNLITEFDVLEARAWPINELVLLAISREILECVVILLCRRGYASRVMPTVELFDEEARKRIPVSKLAAPSFRPQLLLAVRGLTPKKWWGRILGPFS